MAARVRSEEALPPTDRDDRAERGLRFQADGESVAPTGTVAMDVAPCKATSQMEEG